MGWILILLVQAAYALLAEKNSLIGKSQTTQNLLAQSLIQNVLRKLLSTLLFQV